MKKTTISNDELTINSRKVTVTEVGLEFHAWLTDEEWTDLGCRIGRVAKASMFMIGDWLIHREAELGGGKEGRGGRPEEIERRYERAMEITGLDEDTLRWAAGVCRKIPFTVRRSTVSFAHHKVVAKLPEPDQERWLELAAEHKMGKRRLARSIEAGCVLAPEKPETATNPSDKPAEIFRVRVNQICGICRRFLDTGSIAEASREKKEALRRDLRPLVDIYEELAK